MKKSLLLALTFVVVSGYVMAEEEATTTTPAPQDETTQTVPAPKPAPQEEATPATQEDELDMDAMLDETEEAK